MQGKLPGQQGRPLWAALLAIPLAACSHTGTTPMGDTLGEFWGMSDEAHRERARSLSYASLLAEMNGNRSLIVLAYRKDDGDDEVTLWQARDKATLALRNGRPFGSAGFEEELLSLRYQPLPTQTTEYTVHAHWQDAQDVEHHAEGRASLRCGSAEPYPLPLTTLALERCDEEVNWVAGGSSHNTLWRHPDTHRLWAGEVQPWPGASAIEWQVARPWWSE